MKSILLLLVSFWSISVFGQNARISIEKKEVPINEYVQIKAEVLNERLQQHSNFPEITGLKKAHKANSSSMVIVNGQMSSSESIVQNYIPAKEGTVRIPAFTMSINGKTVRFEGETVKITAARTYTDPWEEFFGGYNRRESPKDFIDVKADAFFAVRTDKKEVFVGEGFNMTAAFYVAENNQAILDFPSDVGKQLTDILKKIKPANCWEENFGIEEIVPEIVSLNGKRYRQFKIYEANYFPINAQAIVFPSAPFKMIKLKPSKNGGFFGSQHAKEEALFYSQATEVKVKELPAHPLKGTVAVGNFTMDEKIGSIALETGKSIPYQLRIKGEGNISAINPPQVPPTKNFEIYPPEIRQQITRSQAVVYGEKSFNYNLVANEAGEYVLGDLFFWIYFNPKKAQYDTLRSNAIVKARGESRHNVAIEGNDIGKIGELMDDKYNNLVSLQEGNTENIVINLLMLLGLSASVLTVFWKLRKK